MAISDHCSESMSPFCLATVDYDCYNVSEGQRKAKGKLDVS